MPKAMFISLAVADVARSTAFYEAIGFARNSRMSGDHASSMLWTRDVSINLLSMDFYRTLTAKPVGDARLTSGALFAMSLDSKEEVDLLTEAALAAGGEELHPAEDVGHMYSRAFADLDGYAFGPFWMDANAAAPIPDGA